MDHMSGHVKRIQIFLCRVSKIQITLEERLTSTCTYEPCTAAEQYSRSPAGQLIVLSAPRRIPHSQTSFSKLKRYWIVWQWTSSIMLFISGGLEVLTSGGTLGGLLTPNLSQFPNHVARKNNCFHYCDPIQLWHAYFLIHQLLNEWNSLWKVGMHKIDMKDRHAWNGLKCMKMIEGNFWTTTEIFFLQSRGKNRWALYLN